MTKKNFPPAGQLGLIAGTALLAFLTACAPAAPSTTTVTQVTPPAPAAEPAPTVVVLDDYDYYPSHEVYYSRTRREYVYRDGRNWVRRPQPQGITVDVLFALPSVRVDFRDAPERHHDSVRRSYPRDWKRPDGRRDDKDDKKDDRKRG